MKKSIIKAGFRLMLLSLLTITLASCAGNTNRMVNKTGSYSSDGYLGMSNSNPNMVIHPHHHNYGADRAVMQASLRELNLHHNATFVFNGTRVNVYLTLPKDLSRNQVEMMRTAALHQLNTWVPRYVYTVHTNVD